MHEVKIKPLSANRLWTGRRFPTDEYKVYREQLLWLLPNIEIQEPPFELILEVGLSNKSQDLDNVQKGIIDGLQLKYGFNDKDIYRIVAEKKIVKKGYEYIRFEILNNNANEKI